LKGSAAVSCSQRVDETVYLSVLFSRRRSFEGQRSGVVRMLNGVTDIEEQLQPGLGRHVRALPKNVVFNDYSAP
jgi:hypothetical protein